MSLMANTGTTVFYYYYYYHHHHHSDSADAEKFQKKDVYQELMITMAMDVTCDST